MYASLAYEGLLARFCNILAICKRDVRLSFHNVKLNTLDTYQSQRSPRELRWHTINKHVRLRRDNGRVDEPKEEESTNERADGIVRRLRVFSLFKIKMVF